MANLKYIGKNILNHTLEIKKGDVSGSSSSTGSFGRGEVTTLEASSFGSSASTLISGSFTSTSSSLASRITTAETELGNTLIRSSAQIASDISGSWRGELSSSVYLQNVNIDGIFPARGSGILLEHKFQ